VPSVRPRPVSFSVNNSARSHDRAQNDNRPYHFCAKNEYIDRQFLAGECVAAAAAVTVEKTGRQWGRWANGADVVFTDTVRCKDFGCPDFVYPDFFGTPSNISSSSSSSSSSSVYLFNKTVQIQ